MRPRAYGFLLKLIILVMGEPYENHCIPLDSLSPSQTLILRWGDVVPWAWRTWPDQRTANSEVIRLLVCTCLEPTQRLVSLLLADIYLVFARRFTSSLKSPHR